MKRLSINEDGFEACAAAAAEALASGRLVIALTDTVYGLLGKFTIPGVLENIYKAKNRSIDKQLIALCGDNDAARAMSAIPLPEVLTSRWPGALTAVVPAAQPHPHGWDTQAIRVPDDLFMQAVIGRIDAPLAAPSANLEGQPTVTSHARALAHFPEGVALFIEGDRAPESRPSTIVRITDEHVELLRPGCLDVPGLKTAGDIIPRMD